MAPGAQIAQFAVGFLTVLNFEEQGLIGGYLILNAAGRPLEFHCTAPVKSNRAQQILFGPTLEPYLYGEQIGQTLIAKGSLAPLVVCTDVEPALAAGDFVDPPLVLVLPGTALAESASSTGAVWRVDAAHRASSLKPLALGQNRLALASDNAERARALLDRLQPIARLDLWEPFARIREAIEEAHQQSRGGSSAGKS